MFYKLYDVFKKIELYIFKTYQDMLILDYGCFFEEFCKILPTSYFLPYVHLINNGPTCLLYELLQVWLSYGLFFMSNIEFSRSGLY